MTEFRKLAKRIGRYIDDGFWRCCVDLPEKEAYFFKLWFEPTMKERRIYNHLSGSWMSEKTTPISEDNNLRILALLFAEQLWNDIKEGER